MRIITLALAATLWSTAAAAEPPQQRLGKCQAWFAAVRAVAAVAPIPGAPANITELLELTLEANAAAASMVLNGPQPDIDAYLRGQDLGVRVAWLEIELLAIDYARVRKETDQCVTAMRAAAAGYESAVIAEIMRKLGLN